MKSAEEIEKEFWATPGMRVADIIRQAREEVREECAKIAENFTPGDPKLIVNVFKMVAFAIRDMDLK